MARPASGRAAVQHEDWLNLTAPEPPWFSLPVVKRAFPQGLDPTSEEARAEHKIRWSDARETSDWTDYLNWLLRDALGWGRSYVTSSELPNDLASGVISHDVTIVPSGAHCPEAAAPVGFDFEPDGEDPPPPEPRVLVFVLSARTSPFASPRGDNWSATHVQRAALACRHFGVPLALVTDGDYLTLVHARDKETPTGWGTWRASEFASEPVLLSSFISMLHARRFTAAEPGDTPSALLAESVDSQADITNQLGTQVRQAVELLVNAISRANLDREGALLEGVGPHEVYEAAVTVMMRLVFLLRAEESGLLPVDDLDYQRLYAVRMLREELQAGRQDNPEALETRSTAWHRLLATARAVHSGVQHHHLTHHFVMPAYGGALFDPDRFPFLEGRGSEWRNGPGTPIPVTDLDVLAMLDALLTLRFRSASGVTDTRRLSYRQVDVEQIGHVYERLLDHDVLVADQVVLGCKGRSGDEPEIALSDLEANQIDGTEALLDFLTDKTGRAGGRWVGTRTKIKKWLADPVDRDLRAGLLLACQNDQTLVRRIEPFANLLRLDLRVRPIVFLKGAVYVTETGKNRDSGTAYTTRGLAEELVEHTLAPLCYHPGPAQTADESQWRIRPSSEILDLKVCDPAVGSGAILVAACRYLGYRLVDTWRAEGDPRTEELATADDDPSRLEVVVAARRLVAERCCYGVDRNPMAVEMAKLSMWLTTVAKDRPFSFLDHAIKPGDSLLGIWSFDQLRHLHFDPATGRDHSRSFTGFIDGRDAISRLEELLDEALDLRTQVQELPSHSLTDVTRKAELNRSSETKLAVLAAIADLLSGAALTTAGDRNPSRRLTEVSDTDLDIISELLAAPDMPGDPSVLKRVHQRAQRRLDSTKPATAPSRRPLHWPIAFPEVFTQAGRQPGQFDAMVGNPPFVGGKKITGTAGTDYRSHIVKWIADGATGNADLVSYFFLSATKLARSLGYLATNTIAQGETSEVGLTQIVDKGWSIHRAVSSVRWPGQSSLEIAKCWITDFPWCGQSVLDGRVVNNIDEMLYPTSRSGWRKRRLARYTDISIKGSIIGGSGFILTPEKAQVLISINPCNADVLFPYLGGEDLNQSPTQSAPRWVINFFDWPESKAQQYPDCYRIIEEKVKPQRSINNRASIRNYWWRYTEYQPKLYRTIAELKRVLSITVTSKTVIPSFVPTGQVFSHALVVFAYDNYFHLGVLSSGFHSR